MLGVNASLWSDWTAACSHLPVTWWGVIFGDEVNASDLAKNRISPQRNHTHQQHIQKIDGNREPRVSITLTSLLNRNRHFFRGGGCQPHFPSIYTSYLYTHNTVKEMNGNREPRFSITLTLLLDGNEFLLWGGGDMERGGYSIAPFPSPVDLNLTKSCPGRYAELRNIQTYLPCFPSALRESLYPN